MARAILVTHEFINTQLAKGRWWVDENPFIFKRNVGAYITAQHVSPHSLTWITLSIAMEGLYQALFERGRFNEARFDIFDNILSAKVGTGRLIEED